MFVDLVKTTTTDGLRLDGALNVSSAPGKLELDAVICLHGVASSFYGSTLLEGLIEPLGELGVSTLRVNTRGHDNVSTMSFASGPRRIGAALEIVDECRYDVAGWVKFLVDRGHRRIGLFGHSLGAVKALYATAHEPPPEICCVLAASAPRLSYNAFSAGPTSRDFLEAIATAELNVRQGQPQALFEGKVPFPLLVGSAAYIDKYGRAERYNIFRFLDQIRIPALFLYGELELQRGGVAFAGVSNEIRNRMAERTDVTVGEIPGADHFYTGVRDQMVRAVCDWLVGRFSRS